MAPNFTPCPFCGRAYGSHSLEIHMNRCPHRHSAPLSPKWNPLPGASQRKDGVRTTKEVHGTQHPNSTSNRPNRTLEHAPGSIPISQLPRCRKCNRSFYPDRIARHEEVCIADRPKRKPFNSLRQRCEGLDGAGGYVGRCTSDRGKLPFLGRKGSNKVIRTMGPSTNSRGSSFHPTGGKASHSSSGTHSVWRQQHQELQAAIREARRHTSGFGSNSRNVQPTTSTSKRPVYRQRVGTSGSPPRHVNSIQKKLSSKTNSSDVQHARETSRISGVPHRKSSFDAPAPSHPSNVIAKRPGNTRFSTTGSRDCLVPGSVEVERMLKNSQRLGSSVGIDPRSNLSTFSIFG